jgi:hypothetical protein
MGCITGAAKVTISESFSVLLQLYCIGRRLPSSTMTSNEVSGGLL